MSKTATSIIRDNGKKASNSRRVGGLRCDVPSEGVGDVWTCSLLRSSESAGIWGPDSRSIELLLIVSRQPFNASRATIPQNRFLNRKEQAIVKWDHQSNDQSNRFIALRLENELAYRLRPARLKYPFLSR